MTLRDFILKYDVVFRRVFFVGGNYVLEFFGIIHSISEKLTWRF